MLDWNRDQASPEAAWDRFLLASRPDIGFMQTSWWADFMNARGWGHFGAVFKDGDEILGGARVLSWSFAPGKAYYYVPDGPVLPYKSEDAKQLFEAVLGFIDHKRKLDPNSISHLRLEPRWATCPGFVQGFREARGWLEPRTTLYVDLSLSNEALLAQMKPKCRYNIGVARRVGVMVTEDRSPEGIRDFLDIYGQTMSRHKLRSKSQRYIRDLLAMLSVDERGSLFFAEYQGRRLAAIMAVFHGDIATYFFGGSLAEQRSVMAPYLLHYEVILNAKARGHKWYDFYGVAPANEPGHRWANISAFKRKFGGRELRFGPALDFVFDDAIYTEYLQL